MIRFDPTVCLVYCNYLDEKQKILQKNKGRYKLIGDLIAGAPIVRMNVESAPWVSVGEVRLIINGRRKIVFPVDKPNDPVMKFSGKISLPLEKDCYIAAEVLGNKSLFPVHQARAKNGKFDPPWPKTIHLLEASETEIRDGIGK